MVLHSGVQLRGEKLTSVAKFTVAAGQRVPFVLSHGPSHLADPIVPDAETALSEIDAGWTSWSARCRYQGEWRDTVLRSLLTLKALTYLSHRRHCRRSHHLAAGNAWWRAQLGLSLLLAA